MSSENLKAVAMVKCGPAVFLHEPPVADNVSYKNTRVNLPADHSSVPLLVPPLMPKGARLGGWVQMWVGQQVWLRKLVEAVFWRLHVN